MSLSARLEGLSASQRQRLLVELWKQEPALCREVLRSAPWESLAAFVKTSTPLEDLEIRRALEESLPSSMHPSSLYAVDSFPTTNHGKLDRFALQKETLTRRFVSPTHPSAKTEPATQTTLSVLRGIWEEVLGFEDIEVDDSFFDLGGHSLLATQVIARASEALGIPLEVRHLFEEPTLESLTVLAESLAQEVAVESSETFDEDDGTEENEGVATFEDNRICPLSFAQQSFWFLEQLEPGSEAFIVPVSWRLQGELDVSRLEKAFEQLLERHHILRTVLAETSDGLVQRVLPSTSFSLPVLDLSELSHQQRELEVQAQVESESERRFDLMRGPLFVARLVRSSATEHVLLVTFHHVLADLRSLEVLLDELKALYEGKSLESLPLQYGEYARQQREQAREAGSVEALERWKQRLAGAPAALPLWTDRTGAPEASGLRGMETLVLSPALSEALRRAARDSDATLYMTLLAAFFAFLHRWTGEEELVLGSPVSVRESPEVESLLGFFVNSLVFRGQVSQDTTFRTLLAQLRQYTLDALGDQSCPLEALVEALQPERDATQTALFNVMFSLQYAPWEKTTLGDVELEPLVLTKKKTTMPFHLFAQVDQQISLTFEYKQDLFERSTIRRLLVLLERLWTRLVESPDSAIVTLDWCEEDPSSYPVRVAAQPFVSLLQRFEEQVRVQPEVRAVFDDQQEWSYKELDQRANGVASLLFEAGVRPGQEQVVALHSGRSLEAVAAYIGIWKAGGVVLPVDVQAPDEWLEFVLEDTEAVLLLTDALDSLQLPTLPIPVLSIQGVSLREIWESATPKSSELAYLLFTSGSTGRPKGVMVEHGQLPRLFSVTEESFAFSADDVWTLFHSLAFDFSVWEMWGALAYGGSLLVVPYLVSRDPSAFWEWLLRYKVTMLNQTPSAFSSLMEVALQSEESPASLRWVMFGGEALEPGRLRRWEQRFGFQQPRFANLYGITETTVHVTCRPLKSEELTPEQPSLIGEPLGDLETQICNASGLLQPLGVPGELYVGGAGVSRGYWKRPSLTAERFLAAPGQASTHSEETQWYRTGDLVVQKESGELVYLGRLDQQIQLRGFRVELGEIQGVLESWDEILQAVILVDQRGVEEQLVAFVVIEEGRLLRRDWRTVLSHRLLPYMLPSRLVVVESFPLTLQGKLDRSKLWELERKVEAKEELQLPQTPMEKMLAELWCELLGLESVGREDNFFEAGGHSLIATRLVTEIRERFALHLPLRLIFTTEFTIASLAEWLQKEQLEHAEDDELLSLLEEIEGLSEEEALALLADE